MSNLAPVDSTSPHPSERLLLTELGLASLADLVLLAQQCIRSGNWDQVRALCSAGLSQFGPDPAIDVLLAMAELGTGNNSKAEALLAQVRERCPNHLVASYTAAWMSIENGQPSKARRDLLEVIDKFPDYPGALGTLATVLMPGPSYRDVLSHIHRALKPSTYLEIGVETGATLRLARTATTIVGVDPNLDSIRHSESLTHTKLYRCTSDEFFETQTRASVFESQPLDLVFIDGMHCYEFALRDFWNVEKWANSRTVVAIHDVLPILPLVAARERSTKFWVGDVWKALWALLEFRQDLAISVIPTPPSGLAIIRGLDPQIASDESRRDAAISRYERMAYPNGSSGSFPEHLPLVKNSINGWNATLGVVEGSP
jgi:predicted O-methyltransferase YrrM